MTVIQPEPIPATAGGELNPSHFVGRRAATIRIRQMLENGQHIRLADPWRMGKTSWLRWFEASCTDDRWLQVKVISYTGLNSIRQFVERTVEGLAEIDAMPEAFLDYLRGLFDGLAPDGADGPVRFRMSLPGDEGSALKLMDGIVRTLDKTLGGRTDARPLVLGLDEVPDVILAMLRAGRTADGRNMLDRMRLWRANSRRLRWIIAGSIGLHHVLELAGVSRAAVNDLQPVSFGPLEPAEAEELVQRLVRGLGRRIEPAATASLIERTGAIPHLIQSLAARLRYDEHDMTTIGPITPAEVVSRFTAYIQDRDQSVAPAQLVARIRHDYGPDAPLAFAILDATLGVTGQHEPAPGAATQSGLAEGSPGATTPPGQPGPARLMPTPKTAGQLRAAVMATDRFDAVLNALVEDHYLIAVERGREFAWRYPALRAIYHERRAPWRQ